MLTLLTLYLVTVAVFLACDYFGLSYLIRPIFERHLGDWLIPSFRLGPALVFYLFYIGGVLYFVSVPALVAAAPGQAFWGGLLLGALAYGTYEFSNFATLSRWRWEMVIWDLAWGAMLTGFAAYVGVQVTRIVL